MKQYTKPIDESYCYYKKVDYMREVSIVTNS